MSITDVFKSSRDDDVGNFDQNEATDLALHVRQCSRRYRVLDNKLTFVGRALLFLIFVELAGKVPGAWTAIGALFK